MKQLQEMSVERLLGALGAPSLYDLPKGMMRGPFNWAFATELDQDEGAENTADLSFTAAAGTSGLDKRSQFLFGAGANPPVQGIFWSGLFEWYDAGLFGAQSVEGVVKEANTCYLYHETPGGEHKQRAHLAHHIGVPERALVQSNSTADTAQFNSPTARKCIFPKLFVVDFELDTFAVAYSGGSTITANTPVRASLDGVAWKKGLGLDIAGIRDACAVNGMAAVLEAIAENTIRQRALRYVRAAR